ncbi:MAG: exodeoxyribonuclease I [Pseudomonadales bacterium]|nr:exodeoxyribonuclease I [Pseudomonadales bacterium]MBO6700800.1 exodeoxyribonuclease I [Pseudomonadales bacterium]MBO7004880.1 exodeoxyribonuclease I [Pseudomonadales bacterium]
MPESLYWYDFETTGTDPVIDRPLQFAGVRTDPDLKEIADPQNFFCRPGLDCVPNPEAMLVTGIRMSEVLATGAIERQFADLVLREFSQPQTCVVGFNSIRFDDEFTRQMLYRNFHDPYAREWKSGNSRWDVIDLFRAAHALRPDGFHWPLRDDGTPSFRLEDLARANGLDHLDAHDALADVRATIEVTRRLREAQPRLYDFMFNLKDKRFVVQQLYPLGKQPVVHVSAMFPASRGCTGLVLPLCQHPTNNNGIVVVDLAQPLEKLLSVGPDELARLVFSPSAELGEDETRLALKTIHINRSPFVAPLNTLDESAQQRLGIDIAEAQSRAAQLSRSSGLVEKIQDAFSENRFELSDDPDFQLYQGGFFSESDRSAMNELQSTPPGQLDVYANRFQDDRLEEMLFRFRGRNHSDTLNQSELDRWRTYLQERIGERVPQLRARAIEIMQEADDPSKEILGDLSAYYDRLEEALIRN